MPNVVYPKYTAWVSETVFVTEGEPWNADDPFVQAHPEHFSQSPGQALRGAAPVESATAEPGEKRTTRGRPKMPRDEEGNIVRE